MIVAPTAADEDAAFVTRGAAQSRQPFVIHSDASSAGTPRMNKFAWTPQNIALVLLPVLTLTLLVGESKYVEPLFVHSAYYLLLILVASWAIVYLLAARGLTKTAVWEWVKENKAGIITALAVTVITGLAVHPALRILADETNLLGTSKSFFFNKTATFTVSGKFYYDNFWDAGVVIDRRPSLFPFLVSLLHVVRGYTYTNVFWLNLLVLPVFVLVSYRLAKALGGEVFGVAAGLLVAAHPITLISCRSGGFDFMTAFFSVLVVKSFLDHCRAPSADHLAVLWMNFCMFAEVRYETGLFIVPLVFFLLVFRLAKLEYLRPYRVIYALTPLYLLPRLWQAILRGNVPEQDPGAVVFGFQNFLANARDYFKPLLNPVDYHVPHSAFVIGLGIVGCVLALRWMDKRVARPSRLVPDMQFAVMVSGWMALQFIIVFTYVWGRPLHPASARLLIAIDTFFSFPAAWTLTVALRRLKAVFPTMICAGLFTMYVPVASQYRLLNELTLTREAATTWRFFENLHEKRILVVSDRPGLYTVMDYGAVDFENAKRDPSVLEGLARHLYYDVYLVQQIDLSNNQPLPQFQIWPDRPVQPMLEFQNDANATVRISRVVH